MAKLPARWSASDGSSTATQNSGWLLLESGDVLLLEDAASFLLLEAATLTPKETTNWDANTSKKSAGWASRDGTGTITQAGVGGIRVTQNGTDIRVTQNGTDTRITNENVAVPKPRTTWDTI